jgi:hypothetical protein
MCLPQAICLACKTKEASMVLRNHNLCPSQRSVLLAVWNAALTYHWAQCAHSGHYGDAAKGEQNLWSLKSIQITGVSLHPTQSTLQIEISCFRHCVVAPFSLLECYAVSWQLVHRRFRTTYHSHFQESICPRKLYDHWKWERYVVYFVSKRR